MLFIANFHAANNSHSFKFKQKITGKTADCSTENVEIMVPLKYLSSFWRILEMSLINCEINLILTWSNNVCYLMCYLTWFNNVCYLTWFNNVCYLGLTMCVI